MEQASNPLGGFDACIVSIPEVRGLGQHDVGLCSDLKMEPHNYPLASSRSYTARRINLVAKKQCRHLCGECGSSGF